MCKKILLLLYIMLACFGCSIPSPLTGKWADGMGNSLVLNPDSTFSITVVSATTTESFDGSYAVKNNAITFIFSDRSQILVSEWDIRGSILIIEWPNPDDTTSGLEPFRSLRLYKIG